MALGCALAVATAILLGCGSGDEPRDVSGAAQNARAGDLPRTASTAEPDQADTTDRASDDVDGATAITAAEFCRQAELTITRWDLPDTLGDEVQIGSIELRYRLPPGAEPLVVWMGANLELGAITFGELLSLDPALEELFPNADPDAILPSKVPSHGFDLETDNRTRTISVLITLPAQEMFDGAAPWRWSSLSPPPFAVGAPEVVATFRASGTRVRLDGRHCTPILLPLP